MQKLLVLLFCAGALRAETALVLPFFNQSKAGNLDWIGESIAESVRDSLASEGLLVLGREDRLEAYRRLSLRPGAEITHASVFKIGVSLDASKVIYGSYEFIAAEPGNTQSKGSLRITARVLDVKGSRQGKPFNEVGSLEDLGTLQNHLGWQTLTYVNPRKFPAEQTFMIARPAVRLDAVESYARGLLATSAEQRHRYFTQAARIDEHFSQPCFQLGKASWEQKDYRVAAGWLERVARTDPHYLEAQFFLALCKYSNGDLKAAEQSFQIVVASVPLNEAFNNLGVVQAQRGDYTSAIASFHKALEGDDADPDYHFNLGSALWRAGQYNSAAESFRAVLARKTDDSEATDMLGRALKQQAPRPGETRQEGKPRVKTNYEEQAYRQLQAELGLRQAFIPAIRPPGRIRRATVRPAREAGRGRPARVWRPTLQLPRRSQHVADGPLRFPYDLRVSKRRLRCAIAVDGDSQRPIRRTGRKTRDAIGQPLQHTRVPFDDDEVVLMTRSFSYG